MNFKKNSKNGLLFHKSDIKNQRTILD